jgi:hypothetical protein
MLAMVRRWDYFAETSSDLGRRQAFTECAAELRGWMIDGVADVMEATYSDNPPTAPPDAQGVGRALETEDGNRLLLDRSFREWFRTKPDLAVKIVCAWLDALPAPAAPGTEAAPVFRTKAEIQAALDAQGGAPVAPKGPMRCGCRAGEECCTSAGCDNAAPPPAPAPVTPVELCPFCVAQKRPPHTRGQCHHHNPSFFAPAPPAAPGTESACPTRIATENEPCGCGKMPGFWHTITPRCRGTGRSPGQGGAT